MAKIIAHIDLNAFFVTCEEIKNPSLKGKPVLIGHQGRSGIVSTCSYEARKRGCHSGQPTFQALSCCPEAIILPPDFRFYKVMSNSFFAYISRFSRLIEPASVDECYVDFTSVLKKEKDPLGYLKAIQRGLKEETGLSCSIGIAQTRWLAKMASDLKKPMGLTVIWKKDISRLIYPLPIESFWGIGKKSAPRLRKMGINTIGDFALRIDNDESMKTYLGKFYETAKDWVHGLGSDQIETEEADQKSIGASETLMADAETFYEIEETLKRLCNEVSLRAKKARKKGHLISMSVKDTTFKTHSKNITLTYPTDDPGVLFEKASSLFKKNFEGNAFYRLVGVTLGKLVNPEKENIQMSLWNVDEYIEKDKTKLLINDLNKKMSKPMLKRASEARKEK